MLIGTQCAASRAFLRWSQGDLAAAISEAGGKLSVTAITTFERGGAIRENNSKLIRKALEAQGIQFLENGTVSAGAGVAMKETSDD